MFSGSKQSVFLLSSGSDIKYPDQIFIKSLFSDIS